MRKPSVLVVGKVSATGYSMCIEAERLHHSTPAMTRALCPLYYVEVDGQAVTNHQSGASCMRQFDRKFTGRPDVTAFLVQVEPNAGTEVCRTRIYAEA